MKHNHFDILLFENFHLASNHKYDVMLIARQLQSQGIRVALLDVYGEDIIDEIKGVPVLHLSRQRLIPDDSYMKHPKNKLHSFLAFFRFLWQQHSYLQYVIKEIEPMTDMLYVGSYHTGMSTQLLKMHKPVFVWGLRSSRMTGFWGYFKRQPVVALRMLQLKRTFKRNINNYLFVSNDIIKQEFELLGIPSERMIHREERCVENNEGAFHEELAEDVNFLTIGMLRQEKCVEQTICAFQELKKSKKDITLTLAGQSQQKYEELLVREINKAPNGINRINKFLEYEDFNGLFRKAHFVVFGDARQLSSVTNGTMLEALINHRPVIVPNYLPYSFYIERYKVGIMYNPEKPGDLQRAMRDGINMGCKEFANNICSFLETILFEKVAADLSLALKTIQNKSLCQK